MDILRFFDRYVLIARIAPAFLFVFCVFYLNGYNLLVLNNISNFIFILLLFFVLYPLAHIAAFFSKSLEQYCWKKCENPIIVTLKKDKNLYTELLAKFDNSNDRIVRFLLCQTRSDEKVFWKNVTYGFFRNSLVFTCILLYFSYSRDLDRIFLSTWTDSYLVWNICVCGVNLILIYLSSFYYAKQVIDSYLELEEYQK